MADAKVNPQQFIDLALAAIRNTLHELMVKGIKYERLEGEAYDMMLFESEELIGYLDKIIDVQRSIYDGLIYQSDVERSFAEALDKREDVKLFVKLPDWFEVDTPLGKYRPDWAVVMVDGEQEKLYFIRLGSGAGDPDQVWSGRQSPRPPSGGCTHSPPPAVKRFLLKCLCGC